MFKQRAEMGDDETFRLLLAFMAGWDFALGVLAIGWVALANR